MFMKIDINDHRKLHAIQEEFSAHFPNLRLEFYSRPSHTGGKHPEKIVHQGSKTLGDCRNIHTKGTLTISPAMTVSDLQNNFDEVYGVRVEVLKKTAGGWAEPADKNKLSLQEQNQLN
jgi:hypothetical protein